ANGDRRAVARLCPGACRDALLGGFRHARRGAPAHGRWLDGIGGRDRVDHLGRGGIAAGALDLSRCCRRRGGRDGDSARGAPAAAGEPAMTSLAAAFGRIRKSVLFAVAGVVQIALIALMVADRVMILRTGTDVTLQTQPVDPRDFLRGDYVTLGYAISSVP